jgi:hypothetical protein
MSSSPVAPNHAPAHDTVKKGRPQSQEYDYQYNVATSSAGRSIRCALRDFYFLIYFGVPYLYRNRVQRVMDSAHLSYSDLKLLMALNARNRKERGRVGGDIKAWLGFLETMGDWDELTGSLPQRSMKLRLNPNPDEVTPLSCTIPLPSTRPRPTRSLSGGRLVLTEALDRFQNEWKTFLKNISSEWATLNIVSALMVTYVHKLACLLSYRT